MGQQSSSPIQTCLTNAVGGDNGLVAFPSDILYQMIDVHPYNLDHPVTPAAITYPKTVEMVSRIINCATKYNYKVAARSGGHNYGNYGLGGTDGSVVVDLKNFQQFSMDRSNWQATIGAGTHLGDVTDKLHNAGGRAIAHGTSPQVGLGGHATVGGIGPTSRLYGLTLDHVLEMQVVLANGTITRASSEQNPDLFFAMRGAGASFGIATEFTFRTEPEQGEMVQYEYTFNTGNLTSRAQILKDWQKLVADPDLPHELATQVILTPIGVTLYGTYYGPKEEFDALNMEANFPDMSNSTVTVLDDFLGQVAEWANHAAQAGAGGIPAHFYSKTLTFTNETLIPDFGIDALMEYVYNTDADTALWFVIIDLMGGAISQVDTGSTAFALRDGLFELQSYAINLLGDVTDTTRDFLAGVNRVVLDAVPAVDGNGQYPGYVDPALSNPQERYWRSNLPRLERIKAEYDPREVFSNPQSVRPAKQLTGRRVGFVV